MAPAIRTYTSDNKDKFKKVAFLSVSGSGAGNKKAVSDFETLAGTKTVASLLLTEKVVKQGTLKEKIDSFVKDILAQG
jgi:hypothetical protein